MESLLAKFELHPIAYKGIDLQSAIQSERDMVLRSAIQSFVETMTDSFVRDKVFSEEEFAQLEPLLTKWRGCGQDQPVDWVTFTQFQEDLKGFSGRYPEWWDEGQSMAEWFSATFWDPMFRPMWDKVETHAARVAMYTKVREAAYRLDREATGECCMRYEGRSPDGRLYRFVPAGGHRGHRYYKGASGSPIADPTGKVVSLLVEGSPSRNELYGLPIGDHARLLDLELW